MFCHEYDKNAEKVPIMGFLERILPQKYESDWISLVPTVCSTMRKHLMMKDKFTRATYQPGNLMHLQIIDYYRVRQHF